jgi:hypothetical protein
MNTIPTTFKKLRVPYTIVGGEKIDKRRRKPVDLSLIVLTRNVSVYKPDYIAQLDKCGIPEVIFIEGPAPSYNVDSLCARFPKIRFLLFHEDTSPGERINIGVEESHGRCVLVIWDDIKIVQPLVSGRLVERILENDILCTVPLLQNQKRETIPSIQVPAYFRKRLKMIQLQPGEENMDTLFPFDYIGIYRKERFVRTGGYDFTIRKSYWQKMDFGFRSYMWDERIQCNPGLRLQYVQDPPAEDETPEEGYRRFFLKNLAVRFAGDSGNLPKTKFLPYFFKSGTGFVDALKEFREVREWVGLNRYRFRQDARSVTELWELDEQ